MIRDEHLVSDLLGTLLYLYLRIKGRDDKTISYLRNREYLIYAIDWLSELDEDPYWMFHHGAGEAERKYLENAISTGRIYLASIP